MYTTLTTSDVAHELYADKNAGWSRNGAQALAEYLEEVEFDTGRPMELDIVAIRCEFSEYQSCLDAAVEHGYMPEDEDADEQEQHAKEWLESHGSLIMFDGGVIYG